MRSPKHLIVFALWMTQASFVQSGEPTFSSDVARIVLDKCASCHRDGSSAPFALSSYQEVASRAATIEAVLDSGYMPPWKPVDHGIDFANARNLTAIEEQTLRTWIAAGCPEGDRSQTPQAPEYSEGWTLGKPDLVLTMNGEFEVPADGPDVYRSFVFPLQLPEDKWVKAVELRPRATTAVHHAIFFLDPSGNARKLDGADGKAGMSGMSFLADIGNSVSGSQSGTSDSSGRTTGTRLFQRWRDRRNGVATDELGPRVDGALARGLGGYVPGSTPNWLPGDWAMALPRGSDIVMQTHFHPSGKPEKEKAELAIYFADAPPPQEITPIMLPPMFGFAKGIRIPAGERNYQVRDSLRLPVATQAIGVSGHAHYLCRKMQLTARLPDGREKILLDIDDWDLDWQDQYLFSEAVDLPAGTVLESNITYDNSEDNPENPFHPPKDIRWGRGSNDEMGAMTLMTVAQNKEELPRLLSALRVHSVQPFVGLERSELVSMLMQLDNNSDGTLQPGESPPRMSGRVFQLGDSNRNGGLEANELDRLLRLRSALGGNGL